MTQTPGDGSERSIADLPAQKPSAPASAAQARGLFFNTGNGFNIQLPEVPDLSFTDEPRRALDPATGTGLIACDRAQQLGTPYPATTPLILAHYATIRAGDTLRTEFVASGVMVYAMTGAGATDCGTERIEWRAGDVFILPGNTVHLHTAGRNDSVLWMASNEPQLAFEHLRAPARDDAPTDVVHFTGAEIERQIALLYKVGRGQDIAGSALIFSSTRHEAIRNILPTLTLAMNSLPPGGMQRPHRHNSAAVSLVIEGDQCFSMINGRRKDWSKWATTVTPATAKHAHCNGGKNWARFLIVQDGGIYYYTRAMGFAFADT